VKAASFLRTERPTTTMPTDVRSPPNDKREDVNGHDIDMDKVSNAALALFYILSATRNRGKHSVQLNL